MVRALGAPGELLESTREGHAARARRTPGAHRLELAVYGLPGPWLDPGRLRSACAGSRALLAQREALAPGSTLRLAHPDPRAQAPAPTTASARAARAAPIARICAVARHESGCARAIRTCRSAGASGAAAVGGNAAQGRPAGGEELRWVASTAPAAAILRGTLRRGPEAPASWRCGRGGRGAARCSAGQVKPGDPPAGVAAP